ncbi:hypothetical protein T484DRAFT_1876084, partial [Baffinella frigidus]
MTDGIAGGLQGQKRRAVRSLGLVGRVMAFLNERAGRWSLAGKPCQNVGRVMAFLNERAGRWSLQGSGGKARQAHGDINLLFDEAAMVNEPFLDLMASILADMGGVDDGWRILDH